MEARALVAILSLLTSLGLPAAAGAADDGGAVLVECGVLDISRGFREASSVVEDHLRGGYAESHPSAVALAAAMSQIAASLDSQLHAVEPRYRAFRETSARFHDSVRPTPLPRDPDLGPVLRGFESSVGQLEGLLGCEPPAEARAMIPCRAIFVTHLLAVVAEQVHQYLETHFSDTFPDQVAASAELLRATIALHQTLHDLEIAVPGTRLTYEALVASLDGSSLTDTDEPEDLEVKSRLDRVSEGIAAFAGLTGSCREVAEIHAH